MARRMVEVVPIGRGVITQRIFEVLGIECGDDAKRQIEDVKAVFQVLSRGHIHAVVDRPGENGSTVRKSLTLCDAGPLTLQDAFDA